MRDVVKNNGMPEGAERCLQGAVKHVLREAVPTTVGSGFVATCCEVTRSPPPNGRGHGVIFFI